MLNVLRTPIEKRLQALQKRLVSPQTCRRAVRTQRPRGCKGHSDGATHRRHHSNGHQRWPAVEVPFRHPARPLPAPRHNAATPTAAAALQLDSKQQRCRPLGLLGLGPCGWGGRVEQQPDLFEIGVVSVWCY